MDKKILNDNDNLLITEKSFENEKKLKTEISKYLEEINNLKNEMKLLTSTISNLTEEKENNTNKIINLKKENERLKKENDNIKNNSQISSLNESKKYEDYIKKLKNNFLILDNEKKQLEEVIIKQEEKVNELTNNIQSVQKEIKNKSLRNFFKIR